MNPMNILELQKCQLSKNNDTSLLLDVTDLTNFLGEMTHSEGEFIPFCVRTGPVGKPDPGLLKRYESIEINGEGRAFIMVWIQNRLAAWGSVFAQEGPKHPRKLNIPRGLGIGYDIDLFISFQGRMTGYEVFYELLEGGEE